MFGLHYKDKKVRTDIEFIKEDVKNQIGKHPSNSQILGLLVEVYNNTNPKIKRLPKRNNEFRIKW